MKIFLFFTIFLVISCGEKRYEDNYFIDEVKGFSAQENNIINDLLTEMQIYNPELFSGSKPLLINKNNTAEFGSVEYREFFCEIKINPELTNIFLDELALKYLVLHQLGKCFRLPLSENQEDIMYFKFNSFLVPQIPDKIPEFSKKLGN